MPLWIERYEGKKRISITGKRFLLEQGEMDLKRIFYWQSNPRLEGDARSFEDDDEGTVNDKIFDLMYGPERIRELAKQIHEDGGVNEPIWVGKNEDGLYVVYDGNRRYSAVLHLRKQYPKKYKSIPAVLMEADGLNYSQMLAISTSQNTDGPKEWSPYAKAEMLTNLYDNQIEEGSNEREALVFAKNSMKGAGTIAAVKNQIESHRLINKHNLQKDRFSIVSGGYVTSKHRKAKAAEMVSDGEKPGQLEKIFVKTLKRAERSEKEAFNALQFRDKIKVVWKGGTESDELSKSTFQEFLEGELHLDDAVESFEVAKLGGIERKKIDEFYDFVKGAKNKKKIISALYDDAPLKKKINDLGRYIDLIIKAANNTEDAKIARKKKKIVKKKK